MNLVQKWMLNNISTYKVNERREFLRDCADDTGAAERTIRHHYRTLFKPKNNGSHTNILENNNGKYGEKQPGYSEGPDNIGEMRESQKEQDLKRIEKKERTTEIRTANALEEYTRNLYELLKDFGLTGKRTGKPLKKSVKKSRTVLVNQLGDIHGNEFIDIPGNYYDFEVLGARLQKLAARTIEAASAAGADQILVAMTGDNLNHDSLNLDKRLSNSENRAKATFKMVDLFKQYIEDLSQEFPVAVASVCGNEGRVHAETGYSDLVVSDNYDYTIFNILKLVFSEDENIDFMEGDPKELVVNVCGHNILLLHGEMIKEQCEANVSKLMGRYAAKGLILRYVIFGHLHACRMGDYYGRTSSMCGSNGYSERGLNLTSRASQNLFIVRDNGDVDGIKVDLQNTDDCAGYSTMEDTSRGRGKRKGECLQLVL